MTQLIDLLKPHRTIPNTPWRAANSWDIGFSAMQISRTVILIFGLTLFGIGEAMLLVSSLGNSPWTVLAEGVSNYSPLNIGQATFMISSSVLLLWIPLRQKPGFGTLSNIVVIALAIEIGLHALPTTNSMIVQYLYLFSGIVLVGIGSALYITCGLGTGPRDGLMTGLHYKSGVRVGRVRFGIEVIAATAGYALGGTLGIGTVLFALLIGQSVAISLGVVARHTSQ